MQAFYFSHSIKIIRNNFQEISYKTIGSYVTIEAELLMKTVVR
jgi:hypothetical protein